MDTSRREFFKQAVSTRSLAKLSGVLLGGLQSMLALSHEPGSLEEAGLSLRNLARKPARKPPENSPGMSSPVSQARASDLTGVDSPAGPSGGASETAKPVFPADDDSDQSGAHEERCSGSS